MTDHLDASGSVFALAMSYIVHGQSTYVETGLVSRRLVQVDFGRISDSFFSHRGSDEVAASSACRRTKIDRSNR